MRFKLKLKSNSQSVTEKFYRIFDDNLTGSDKVLTLKDIGFSEDEMKIKAQYAEDQPICEEYDRRVEKLTSGNASEKEKKQWLKEYLSEQGEKEVVYRGVDLWDCEDISLVHINNKRTKYEFDLGDPILDEDLIRFSSRLSQLLNIEVKATLYHEDDPESRAKYDFPEDGDTYNEVVEVDKEELPGNFYTNFLKIISLSVAALTLAFLGIYIFTEFTIPWWGYLLSFIAVPTYFILPFCGQAEFSSIDKTSILKGFFASLVSLASIYFFYNDALGEKYSEYILYASILATLFFISGEVVIWLKGQLETTLIENFLLFGPVIIAINTFAVASFFKIYQ